MKTIILSVSLILCSLGGFSQKTDLQSSTEKAPKTIVTAPEERIIRLEAEIASLKAAQAEMKKQLSEIQSSLPSDTKTKKLIINRAGSKQASWAPVQEQ